MRPHPGAHTHWPITGKNSPPPPPPPSKGATSSQKRGGEGGETKKYTWKGTPTLRGVSNIPTVNLFG